MTQNPLNDSSTQSSKTPGLKPALAAALASLEVQLDQELARYRRTRTGSRIPNQSRVASYISSQPQQLYTIQTTSGVEIKTNVPPASGSANLEEDSAPATAKINEPPAPVSVNLTGSPEPTAQTEELDHPKMPSTPDSPKTQTPPPPPHFNSSIVPTVVKTPKSENILQPNDSPTQPNDYLESSEALLRSLTEEQPDTKKTNKSNDSLLSPLGIGSMLLLLVASLTLGYVAFNPKTLQQLNLGNSSKGESSSTTDNAEKVESNAEPQSQPDLTPIPKYPNLAAKEFPEVRDLNDVVGLKPKVQPSPVAIPNQIVPQNPTNPQAVLNPVAPQNPTNPQLAVPNSTGVFKPTNPIATAPLPPLSLPPTSAVKTSPKPTVTSTKPGAEIKPAADGFYHVVIDNQRERSLTSARQVIPDAYLSLDKKSIYLGAFKTKEEVQQHLRLLESKGIKARVQQP